jgi:precorrin-6Y C5,15-methyltransferase (decarboxylating)
VSDQSPPPGTFPPLPLAGPGGSGAPIIVLGLPAGQPLPAADLYVGAPRHLELTPLGATSLALGPGGVDLASALDRIADMVSTGRRVCVLAAGDPGFFSVGRALAERFGPTNLEVHPAPSPVSLAFARLGLPWDDAVVVSTEGRHRNEAMIAAHTATSSGHKVALLTSPEAPPARVGQALLEARTGDRKASPAEAATDEVTVAVCSRLGTPREQVNLTDLAGLAKGSWDAVSVVILIPDQALDNHGPLPISWASGARSWLAGTRFGREAAVFASRDGLAGAPEVRAVVLSKLDLPLTGVVWDVGAGYASVAIEVALLSPGLEVHAIERDPRIATQARANANRQSAAVRVHNLHAPEALAALPKPDRVFLGGGGADVLEACIRYVRPGGRVVAAFRLLGQAVVAAQRLGALVQVSVCHGEVTPNHGWRLAANDPVFIAWGPP